MRIYDQQPILLLGDVTPLVYLATVGQLDLLVAERLLVIPDIVVYNATEDLRWPYAPEIAAWLGNVSATYGQRSERATGKPEAPHKLQIAVTESGQSHAAAKLYWPLQSAGAAGWAGLGSWLYNYFAAAKGDILFLAEDAKRHGYPEAAETKAKVQCVTTLDYLRVCDARNHSPSADKLWENIQWHAGKRDLLADIARR